MAWVGTLISCRTRAGPECLGPGPYSPPPLCTPLLPNVWIGFAWQYSQACGHPCYLCTFSYPISFFQSTLHLICFDTALCEEPPLSVIIQYSATYPVCGGCQGSSSGPLPSPPLLWFQRTRDKQNLYCIDGHLMKLKCKYSIILRLFVCLKYFIEWENTI